MSVEATSKFISEAEIFDAFCEEHQPPTDLIFDDGVALESARHRIAIDVLIRSLEHAWSERTDFYTGGNMFIYYSKIQARNRDFKGPDFFAVLGVDGTISRQGWVVWEENGRYPDVIIELMSPSTAQQDLGVKKDLYEQVFSTRNYFVFNPFDPDSLQGWRLNGGVYYQELERNQQGWLWCETLGFWLGTWAGTIQRETAVWLRFYDESGNLILLPEEAAQQQAELAQQQAETAQQQAETAQQQAEQESLRAEQQSLQAEQERQRGDRLAAKLRELGIDPNALNE